MIDYRLAHRVLAWVALPAALVFGYGGCVQEEDDAECDSTADCKNGRVCKGGECEACTSYTECGASGACSEGRCVNALPEYAPCEFEAECRSSSNSLAVCALAGDHGFICSEECQESAQGVAVGDCIDSYRCDNGCCLVQEVGGSTGYGLCAPGVPAPPSGLGGIGDACISGNECASGSCTGSWCNQPCSTDADCAGSHGGLNEFGETNYCIETTSGDLRCFPGCEGPNAGCSGYHSSIECDEYTRDNGVVIHMCSS
jgi:hypothetical protein